MLFSSYPSVSLVGRRLKLRWEIEGLNIGRTQFYFTGFQALCCFPHMSLHSEGVEGTGGLLGRLQSHSHFFRLYIVLLILFDELPQLHNLITAILSEDYQLAHHHIGEVKAVGCLFCVVACLFCSVFFV